MHPLRELEYSLSFDNNVDNLVRNADFLDNSLALDERNDLFVCLCGYNGIGSRTVERKLDGSTNLAVDLNSYFNGAIYGLGFIPQRK